MHNVFKGIAVGVLGAILWTLFSVLQGVGEAFGTPEPFFEAFMMIGFALMIGGPVVYIVVIPAVGWLRRRRSREG